MEVGFRECEARRNPVKRVCTQHREAGRRSADENLMFEGIGSNSQQAGLRICRTNALLANL